MGNGEYSGNEDVDGADAGSEKKSGLGRRSLMFGAAAGVGAAAATLVGNASPAGAAQGSAVDLGVDNTGGKKRTGVFSTVTNLYATIADPDLGLELWVQDQPVGVFGSGFTGVVGVSGASQNGNGLGQQSFGVLGTDSGVNGGSTFNGGAIAVGGILETNTNDQPAVLGQTAGTGPGVLGVSVESSDMTLSSSGAGVLGDSNTNPGVTGLSSGDVGVMGVSTVSGGVTGQSVAASGFSVGTAGVLGDSTTNPGVIGLSSGNAGVYGLSKTSDGVHGITQANGSYGVAGTDNSADGGYGVGGQSNFGSGVYGLNEGASGVVGPDHSNLAGVLGDSDTNPGVIGTSSGWDGISGVTSANGHSGVSGFDISKSGGFGLFGQSANGSALKVVGPATFSRSGIVSIAAGKSSATVTSVPLSSASIVLANLQNNLSGVYVQSVVPGTTSFKINLSKAVPSGDTASVGWFVVN